LNAKGSVDFIDIDAVMIKNIEPRLDSGQRWLAFVQRRKRECR
jgi:hypothetical protein